MKHGSKRKLLTYTCKYYPKANDEEGDETES